jgi:SNF2 family DNA or RNA helicase
MTLDPIHYDLNPDHAKLYRALAEQQIEPVKADGAVRRDMESNIYQTLQQSILNPSMFGTAQVRATALELLDEILAELDTANLSEGRKLVVVAWYKPTIAMLMDYLNQPSTTWSGYAGAAVRISGGMTDKQKDDAKDRFCGDPTCRIIILQPRSGGSGTDGLQEVCSDALFLEIPPTSTDFDQTVGRLDRNGQTRPVHIRVALAEGTVQWKLWQNCLNNDHLANKVQVAYQDLRAAVYGGQKGKA